MSRFDPGAGGVLVLERVRVLGAARGLQRLMFRLLWGRTVSPRGPAAARVQDGRGGQAARVARAQEMVMMPWPR